MEQHDKALLEKLENRKMGTRHRIASLIHTNYAELSELLELSDEEIHAAYNEMRAEQDS
ncbi:hypothetical protein [Listeria ilorinensis]|uniref:hypothetical protein n=1 Tax=Listeria ilorinensis TaxID=2867439 RepID=UPI001EF5F5D6|nr:hypothetical protein [Listeria ilorinensis]